MKPPKFIACYDSGEEFVDRYTVVFTRALKSFHGRKYFMYIGMSARLDVGIHSDSIERIDSPGHNLGKRINFNDLPKKCRDLVISDYREIYPKSVFA